MPGDKSNQRKAVEQPNDAEAKVEEEEFDQGAFDEAVASETKRIEQLFGPLETTQEVAIAFEYVTALGNSRQDHIKVDAWAAYVGADGPDIETIKLWEISVYRKIRRPTRFFLRGQKKLDPDTVDMLGTTIDYWIWFEREGKLSEKHRVIASQVKADGGSRADMFLATMKHFKEEMAIQKWDRYTVNLLCLSICQVDSNLSGYHSAKRLRNEHTRATRAGPSTASVPSRPAPRISDSPIPPASQIPLTPREKAQRIKSHATTLTQTISNWEEAEKTANVDRDFVKATGVELKGEIDDMLMDETEWTVDSTRRRAAKFESLLRKFSKSWETDLPSSLGAMEEAAKAVELTEATLSGLEERLSASTNGVGRLSGR